MVPDRGPCGKNDSATVLNSSPGMLPTQLRRSGEGPLVSVRFSTASKQMSPNRLSRTASPGVDAAVSMSKLMVTNRLRRTHSFGGVPEAGSGPGLVVGVNTFLPSETHALVYGGGGDKTGSGMVISPWPWHEAKESVETTRVNLIRTSPRATARRNARLRFIGPHGARCRSIRSRNYETEGSLSIGKPLRPESLSGGAAEGWRPSMRGEPLLMVVLSATVAGAAESRGSWPVLTGADLACLVIDAEGALRPNSKALREDPTCNTEWVREQLGVPAADGILEALANAVKLRPGRPGTGSIIALMDTGYRAHPELGAMDDAGAILLHDPYADPDAPEFGRRLPLNYVEGCPPDLKFGCAPRIERAKRSTVRDDTQKALGDPLPRFTTPILAPLLNKAPLRQPGHATGTA